MVLSMSRASACSLLKGSWQERCLLNRCLESVRGYDKPSLLPSLSGLQQLHCVQMICLPCHPQYGRTHSLSKIVLKLCGHIAQTAAVGLQVSYCIRPDRLVITFSDVAVYDGWLTAQMELFLRPGRYPAGSVRVSYVGTPPDDDLSAAISALPISAADLTTSRASRVVCSYSSYNTCASPQVGKHEIAYTSKNEEKSVGKLSMPILRRKVAAEHSSCCRQQIVRGS